MWPNETHSAVPVIVGVGQVTNRAPDIQREPLDLLIDAVQDATQDSKAGRALLDMVDSVDVVNVMSWVYDDLPGRLAERLELRPVRAAYSPRGGDQPTRLIDRAASRIAAGQSRVALIAGAEAFASIEHARRQGEPLPWTPQPPGAVSPLDTRTQVGPVAWSHGLRMPIDIYPLYESGTRAAWAQSAEDAAAWSSEIWSDFSTVAAAHPGAWNPTRRNPAEILATGPGNRMVAHPYPKLLCAQMSVDQAAAVLMTDAATARALGIPEERWIYPWGGAGAQDTVNPLARVSYGRAPAMETALDGALRTADVGLECIDLLELYSCFPCVTKLASRHLGLPRGRRLSIIGGLTFFGGPGNAYMLCATAGAVEALRRGDGHKALLYGNGEFVTKHHALVLAADPRPDGRYPCDDEPARQRAVDALASPPFEVAPRGRAVIEACTVVYGREPQSDRGIVVGRLDDGKRFVANTAPGDAETVAALVSDADEPVGRRGRVSPAGPSDELNRFVID